MKITLFISLLAITANPARVCQCVPLTFEDEVKNSKMIFLGKVTTVNGYAYDIEILKTWKGNNHGAFHLIQGGTSCEKRTFEVGKEYIFYLKHAAVDNCSRTNQYNLTDDVQRLNKQFMSK